MSHLLCAWQKQIVPVVKDINPSLAFIHDNQEKKGHSRFFHLA